MLDRVLSGVVAYTVAVGHEWGVRTARKRESVCCEDAERNEKFYTLREGR